MDSRIRKKDQKTSLGHHFPEEFNNHGKRETQIIPDEIDRCIDDEKSLKRDFSAKQVHGGSKDGWIW